MNPTEVCVRLVWSTALVLLLAACATDGEQIIDDPVVDEPEPEFSHICEALTYQAAEAGEPWTPTDVDDCYVGCDEGEAAGFDQGRLVCIMDGEFCPECVADQEGAGFDAGYKACYASAYRAGYADEGCLEP